MKNVLHTIARVLIAVTAFVATAVVPQVASAQNDPFIGRWTLNVARSSFTPGPGPRSGVAVITASGQGLTGTVDMVDAQGASSRAVYPFTCDGQTRPVTGDPDIDAMSCQRPDPYTFEITNMKGGRTVLTEVLTLSADGKTGIDNIRGVNAAGQRMITASLWEKQ